MSFNNLFKKKSNKLLFTTPSHSQHFFVVNKYRHFYKNDISETETHNPEFELENSEKRASEIYDVNQTLYLTNGSTSGIITAVLACVKPGEQVLIWNNAHRCHKNAVALAGGIPVYYDLPIIQEWGINGKTTVEIIEPHFKGNNIKAVIVTSPSYYGIVSDIDSIKQLCEKYGVYLIVDEAHGALYPFSDKLPESAVKYADIVVQSLHKTAGGLNPTALLHSNLDFDIKPYFDLVNTTSPSYPLLHSIESNINYLNSKNGKIKLDKLILTINKMKQICSNVEFYGDDPTKILIKKSCYSGYELSEILFEKFDIEDEITNDKSTMLLCGVGTSEKKLKKLFSSLNKLT